ACQQTNLDTLAACREAAESDYKVALGKCVNITDPATQKDCREQAATDRADAIQTCQGGLEVRRVACQKLGPAPYDPVIDPANFVARIDNPYFPLRPGPTFIYEGQMPQGFERCGFAVTHNTMVSLGVTCGEGHDRVVTDGV